MLSPVFWTRLKLLTFLEPTYTFLPHSYRIASAGRVLAALHAGYRLPSAPNNTATPNPSSTSSGVMVTEMEADEAEPMDTPAVDTVLFPA